VKILKHKSIASCPRNLWQSLAWFCAYLPNDMKYYTLLTIVICWSIWITRNKITFEGYKLKNPLVITFTLCAFLKYWACLYKEEDARKIREGAQVMANKASELAKNLQQSSSQTAMLMI
jgi:hypothetical protein